MLRISTGLLRAGRLKSSVNSLLLSNSICRPWQKNTITVIILVFWFGLIANLSGSEPSRTGPASLSADAWHDTEKTTETGVFNAPLADKGHFVDSLLRAIPVAVFYKDREGRYQGCNDEFTRIQGVTNAQIMGKTVYELWPGALAAKYHQTDLDLMKNPQHQVYEFQVKDKDGNFRPVIFGKQVYYDQKGEVAGLVGAFVDVSTQKTLENRQRWYLIALAAGMVLQLLLIVALIRAFLNGKKAASSLVQSEMKYRRLAQNLSAVVYQFKMTPDGVCSFPFVNEKLFSATGIKPEEAMRDVNAVLDKISPDERNAFQESMHRSAQRLDPFHCVFRYENNGQISWIEARSTPERLPDGSTIWDGFFFDISEQKNNEEALRESEARLNKILSVVPDMVSVHDKDMNIVYSNWNGFGAVQTDLRLTGTKCYKTYRGFDEICPGCLARSVCETRTPCVAESLLPDGRWVELRVLPILDRNGNFELFVEWVRDITSRKHVEQLVAAKNKELEQILYVASHDLRSPLVNIDGYSREVDFAISGLQKAIASAVAASDFENTAQPILSDIKDSLTHIHKSAKQMDWQLKGLLKLSRLGRAALSIGLVDMNRLMNEVVAANGFAASKNGVDLQIESLPPCIGDVIQVTQVFVNLIGNAVKYLDNSRPGVIRVSGKVERGRCIYCVEDNGIGIASHHQEKIFELFHRLEPSKTEGEGLGLTIVRQILEMIDGEITVESTPGVGSCFRVNLPSPGARIEVGN